MTRDDDPLDPPSAAASTPFDSVVGRVEAQLARGLPSGPVESPVPPSPVAIGSGRVLAAGIALGVGLLAAGANAWITVGAARLAQWGGGPSRSAVYRFVASAGWRWGTLVATASLCTAAFALARRGQRWPAYVASAVILSVLGLSVYGHQQRLNELFGGWTFYTPESIRE